MRGRYLGGKLCAALGTIFHVSCLRSSIFAVILTPISRALIAIKNHNSIQLKTMHWPFKILKSIYDHNFRVSKIKFLEENRLR